MSCRIPGMPLRCYLSENERAAVWLHCNSNARVAQTRAQLQNLFTTTGGCQSIKGISKHLLYLQENVYRMHKNSNSFEIIQRKINQTGNMGTVHLEFDSPPKNNNLELDVNHQTKISIIITLSYPHQTISGSSFSTTFGRFKISVKWSFWLFELNQSLKDLISVSLSLCNPL